ncbi:uncharacterized protein LOC143273016 isoform X12 [Peromyscus maniculatus bairdii]|uniref:uncharacterized protein LOC143273016 isoform X12 n=1 Tax=Peromyscus maniculatus bairdii TaxID=230844 RepID=UPI003FCF1C45
MPRLGAVRRLPPSAGRSDARLPAGHRRNPTGAEQCPCAAEKTARVSWADPPLAVSSRPSSHVPAMMFLLSMYASTVSRAKGP